MRSIKPISGRLKRRLRRRGWRQNSYQLWHSPEQLRQVDPPPGRTLRIASVHAGLLRREP